MAVWAGTTATRPDHKWISSAKDSLLAHLRSCSVQDAFVRERAGEELSTSRAGRGGRIQIAAAVPVSTPSPVPPTFLTTGTPFEAASGAASMGMAGPSSISGSFPFPPLTAPRPIHAVSSGVPGWSGSASGSGYNTPGSAGGSKSISFSIFVEVLI